MFRQSPSSAHRLYSSFGQRRKLFLLVFLWTCVCLVIFKSSLFNSKSAQQQQQQQQQEQDQDQDQLEQLDQLTNTNLYQSSNHRHHAIDSKLFARSPSNGPPNWLLGGSSMAPIYLAPEFALPDNSNALYYSLSSISSSPASSSASSSSSASVKAAEQQQQQPSLVKSVDQQPAAISQTSQSPKGKVKPAPVVIAGSQCHYKYPNLLDLQFNNIHWQKLTTKTNASSQATFYLYNAYYDDRWRGGVPSVRILAMIDRIQPPPTNCLLWSSKRPKSLGPIVTRASFVYAWYPKWGNYKDGLLQPWIVTCPVGRPHLGLVPDSVSLVEVPVQLPPKSQKQPQANQVIAATRGANVIQAGQQATTTDERQKRQAELTLGSSLNPPAVSTSFIAMPPSFSSTSPSIPLASSSASINLPRVSQTSSTSLLQGNTRIMPNSGGGGGGGNPNEELTSVSYDCSSTLPITNNLPVFNQRPPVKGKFAVCVKGLDFPHEDVSVRLVEWIELLNLLGAGKIFLYNLDVHENISKVLHYYQQRGIVELSPLTLPGDQPNLPEYQHLYLKSKLTAKRQNELIPYNDCLYRNLNSYQYLALLDIDEIIMPLKNHHNWYDLMQEVEQQSLSEQNYSRASYNVRNVYFFDDLAGPLGTTSSSSSSSPPLSVSRLDGGLELPESSEEEAENSNNNNNNSQQVGGSQRDESSLERGIPHYLHMMQHVYRSKNYTKPGQYVKCFHNTERVVSLHNHFPMNCFGQCTTYSIPVQLAHLQHYRKDCVGPLKQSCKNDFRVFTTRDTTIWKYKQQMIRRTTRVLNHLSLL